jgi:UDP-N-acetylmuramoyl-L-alanyl-D-glutamate--2,6-diaminopimelate ligase
VIHVARRSVRVDELVARIPAGGVRDVVGAGGVMVTDVTLDSSAVLPGSLFACVVGASRDGHDFAAAAVAAGATCLLVSRRLDVDVTQVVVDDVRSRLGHVAAAFHGDPSRALTTVGITGTNGKTTTTQLLAAILRAAGRETGVMGTLTGARTTPEAPELQRHLGALRDDGADAVVMEVSSHALALHRVTGTSFDAAVFTNLGRDHLDLHETMEEYFRAKASLFTPELAAVGVTNLDDPHGRLLFDAAPIEMVPYARDDAGDVEVGIASHRFTWRGRRFEVPLGGDVNVMNSLAAVTTAAVLGVDPAIAADGLSSLPPVPGRFEVIPSGAPFTVMVDYAHTPDGIRELLRSARAAARRDVGAGGRIVLVFGCGGDRDRDKRPEMGAAAADGADRVIVTSDNPRHEDPMAIIDAVVLGVPAGYRERVVIEPDRRAAIATALGDARPGDVVVIAGKGHETTQTIGDAILPFDDRVVARELLQELS